jgi:DNA end-binding protein Ku
MAPRANWKGYLKAGELTCAVALYTAASTSERISFHIINRRTGNRVHRQQFDSETGKEVSNDDIVKGYELENGEYVVLEPDEIAAALPGSDKTLDMADFIGCDAIDTVFLERPYYLAPTDSAAAEVFALIRDGMRAKKVAALVQTVLFRRLRTLLVRPDGDGMIATTLNFDYEVRPADEVFDDIPDIRISDEMLDLAKHIIGTKNKAFDPQTFDDRYENALQEMIKAKIEGRKIKLAPPPTETKVTDLMEALRRSADQSGSAKTKAKPGKRTAKKATAAEKPKRKAG